MRRFAIASEMWSARLRATAAQEIKDSVEDLAAVMFEGATSFTGLGQQRLQDAPFAVAHIARIWFAFAHAVQPLATTRPYPLYWTRSKGSRSQVAQTQWR